MKISVGSILSVKISPYSLISVTVAVGAFFTRSILFMQDGL